MNGKKIVLLTTSMDAQYVNELDAFHAFYFAHSYSLQCTCCVDLTNRIPINMITPIKIECITFICLVRNWNRTKTNRRWKINKIHTSHNKIISVDESERNKKKFCLFGFRNHNFGFIIVAWEASYLKMTEYKSAICFVVCTQVYTIYNCYDFCVWSSVVAERDWARTRWGDCQSPMKCC